MIERQTAASDGDDDVGVQPRPGNEDRQESGRHDRPRRRCDPGGPGSADQIGRQNDGDEVHHDGDDDFAGAGPQAQHRRDEGPKAARDECGDEHGRKHQGPGQIEPVEADSDGRDGAEIELTVGPDIPQPATEAENDRERRQNDRCGIEQGLGDRADRFESTAENFPIGEERVYAARQQQHSGDRKRADMMANPVPIARKRSSAGGAMVEAVVKLPSRRRRISPA